MHSVNIHSRQMTDKTLNERFSLTFTLKRGEHIYYKPRGIALRKI